IPAHPFFHQQDQVEGRAGARLMIQMTMGLQTPKKMNTGQMPTIPTQTKTASWTGRTDGRCVTN
ncbi:MAG: hypothetical protein ACSHX7_12965, partial [Luteolibacter sp.]